MGPIVFRELCDELLIAYCCSIDFDALRSFS